MARRCDSRGAIAGALPQRMGARHDLWPVQYGHAGRHICDAQALRENGVGDASIARRIRKMGEEFYGLAKAMDEALEADAPQKEIAAVLQRNVQPNFEHAMALADHLIPISERVDALSDGAALAGPDAV